MKEIDKNINECEGGATGAIAFGDIAGMGDITFPGELGEGEPGSGDLPLPSGKLYKQVAPFDTFLKTKKKRKKLKNQKHTPNTPHYAYVDDFKTYVERTYTSKNPHPSDIGRKGHGLVKPVNPNAIYN